METKKKQIKKKIKGLEEKLKKVKRLKGEFDSLNLFGEEVESNRSVKRRKIQEQIKELTDKLKKEVRNSSQP